MVDNKSKTSLIRHIQKKISLMKINNIILVICISSFVIYFFCICHLGSFPIVVIATFHIDIVTHIKHIFIGFDDISAEHPKNFKE